MKLYFKKSQRNTHFQEIKIEGRKFNIKVLASFQWSCGIRRLNDLKYQRRKKINFRWPFTNSYNDKIYIFYK